MDNGSSPKTLDTLIASGVEGKTVLIRADLNVPIDEQGEVRDATRLERIIPTLKALTKAGACVALLSHFGRPKGQIVAEMSLQPVVGALSKLLGQTVGFADNCIGDSAAQACANMANGDVIILENTRFHPGEEKNDKDFAQAIATLGAAYVNDAFSAAHRAHASTEAIAHLLPSYVGYAMQAELDALQAALGNPARPAIAVVGGAKISTKLDLLSNLSKKVDRLVIGGGMANTFLAAQGYAIGTSLCEDTMLETARTIIKDAAANGCEIILPVDVAIAPAFKAGQTPTIVYIDSVPEDQMILDAGPQSIKDICLAFDNSKTLIWNGPLGAFEIDPFDAATNQTAQHAATLTQSGKLVSVAGGGDTVAALNQAGAGPQFTYVSTAGGAFLEWLEGKDLPGVTALTN